MNLIVNVSRNWAIGKNNSLLFHLSQDMKFFKSHTVGKTVIMGRKTLESLPGSKPLPNRDNIVITKSKNYSFENVTVCGSIDELLELLKKLNTDDVYVMGGESIYKELLPYCTKAFVTKVDACVDEADAFMVDLDASPEWEPVEISEIHSENGLDFTFVTYKRI